MIKYKELLKPSELIDFAYSRIHGPSVDNLNTFLQSKLKDHYTIIRKAILLELYEKGKNSLSDECVEELYYLDISDKE